MINRFDQQASLAAENARRHDEATISAVGDPDLRVAIYQTRAEAAMVTAQLSMLNVQVEKLHQSLRIFGVVAAVLLAVVAAAALGFR